MYISKYGDDGACSRALIIDVMRKKMITERYFIYLEFKFREKKKVNPTINSLAWKARNLGG